MSLKYNELSNFDGMTYFICGTGKKRYGARAHTK